MKCKKCLTDRRVLAGTRGLVVLSLLFLSAAGLLSAQECAPPPGMRRSRTITPTRLEQLASSPGEPVLVESDVRDPTGPAGELESVARMHALFETPIQAFEDALRAVEEQDDYLPRLEESEILCSRGTPAEYIRVRQQLSFRFLFFGRDYEYVLHYFFDDQSAGTFVVWWQLATSLDDQILETDGTWYFEEVVVEGDTYTYMTYATRTLFREESFGLRKAIERFGERDLRNAMTALNDEARRR